MKYDSLNFEIKIVMSKRKYNRYTQKMQSQMFADGGLLSPLKGVQGFNMNMKPAIDISSIDIKGVPMTGKPKSSLGLSSLGNVASGLFGSLISSPTGALQDTKNPEDFEVSTSTSRDDLLKRMNAFEGVDFGSSGIDPAKTGFTKGLQGVVSGVSSGAAAGPIGMIAGAASGIAKGIFGGIRARKQKKKLQKAEEEATQKQLDAFSQQNTALDLKDTFSTMSNYYAHGGKIKTKEPSLHSTEDFDNPVYSEKAPLPISKQKELIIESGKKSGIKNFEKAVVIGKAVANAHPIVGSVLDVIDVAEGFKNNDVNEVFTNTSGMVGKVNEQFVSKVAKPARRISNKLLGRVSGGLFAIPDILSDAKEAYDIINKDNEYAHGGDINIKPSKKGTFTKAAKQRGYGVQEFANKVLNNKENYSEAMQKKAQFAHNSAQWQHANGGELIEFNNGDSHEQNPFGGIPMGIGPNGLPNTVEQGETMKDNYVYSDRNKIDEELIEAIGLPNNLKGKTFAEASKIIQEEAKERPNDPISKRGLDRSLGILREAQELYNEVNMPKQSNNEFAIGGVLNKIGTGVSNAMEYAPLAFNLGTAFSNLNQKPEVVDLPELSSPEKLQSRSVYTPTDRNYIANQIRGIGRANERNIRNTAGGSSGATMAGLLASNYGTQKNIGEAFATIDRMNLGQKQNIAKEQMQADQFNIGNQAAVDRYNTEMLMREQDLNARNRAAARAAKQKGFGVVAENLGQLSQANLMKDMLGMAYGYTWDKQKRRWIKE